MNNNIIVFQDENADYCVIAGTANRAEAEVALRKEEEVWFGPLEKRNPDDDMEKPMNLGDFSAATLFHGTKNGEEGYYWGEDPEKYFDGGKYETESGFIAVLN